MKKDKLDIDKFFKEYVDSLPESNLPDEIDLKLKNSIFEKLTSINEEKAENENSKIPQIIFKSKYAYVSIAAASLLIVVSIYFLLNYKSQEDINNKSIITNFDLNKNQSNIDTATVNNKFEKNVIEENQIATLDYNFTTRGLSDTEDKIDDKVLKIVLDEFKSIQLNYTKSNNVILSEQFLYEEKISSLKIKIDKNNQVINFIILSKNNKDNKDVNLKINPHKIINKIEQKIVSLIEIE